MRKYFKLIQSIIVICILSFCAVSCEDGPNDPPKTDNENTIPDHAESTILIYAVATNSLSSNLVSDKREMVYAADDIDLSKHNVLLFQAVYEYENNVKTGNGLSTLLRLQKKGDTYDWVTVKEYDYNTAPLNPQRISEVIDYTCENFPSDTYGLVFWSHSTASDPYLPQTKSLENAVKLPEEYSFGQDMIVGAGNPDYQINVEDLASAIPDKVFNFIWFDSCYMSNIESIYQLRNKCDFFIGYPTEILDEGMPYHYTLPLLCNSSPNIVGAAERLFEYYENEYYWNLCTIAVIDMKEINTLRDYCHTIYDGNTSMPSLSGLHKYTNNRQSSGPFYDLGDYTKAVAQLNGNSIKNEEWEAALSKCVIYKAATIYDFNSVKIPQSRFSGISTFVYNIGSNTDKERYYESLDWFKTVYSSTNEE